MSRRLLAAVAALLVLALAVPAAEDCRPFGPGSYRQLVAARGDSPFLLLLWSIDCPPCLREFELLAELRRGGALLPIVLVATDDLSQRAAVTDVLGRFGLADLESWIFADANAQRLRFEIDPRWYGEMPRSYFFIPGGERLVHSGGLDRAALQAWLVAAGASP